MKNASGFFQEASGSFSNTRLLVTALVAYGIIGSASVLGFGLHKYMQPNSTETLLSIVTAAGAFVSSIAAVAGGWKVMQKGQEANAVDEVKAI